MAGKNTIKIIVIVLGSMLTFGLIMFFSIAFLLKTTFEDSEPYNHTMEVLKTNSETVDFLGDNIERSGMFTGSIKSDLSGTSVSISFEVTGSKSKADIYINAIRTNKDWKYNKIILLKNCDTVEKIDLTPIE
ncbi:MAG: hypothetical protein IKQ46_18600 [Bacteroidales bacterium]|jgi:hypothetical protein|nr:hypothetical protein [Bacteroidales bacterium]